jgi:HEAT repeat protein
MACASRLKKQVADVSSRATYYQTYSLFDTEIALKLATDLVNAGIDTWNDRLQLPEMSDRVGAIGQALNRARTVLGLVSPTFINARYAAHEWNHAKRKGKTTLSLRVAPISRTAISPVNDVAAYMRENVRLSRALDFDRWRDENAYRRELARLIAMFGEIPADSMPDARTQYVNHLLRQAATSQFYAEILGVPSDLEGPTLGAKVREGSRIEEIWGRLGRVAASQDGRTYELSLASVRATATRFALHGASGSGKTTALQRLIMDAARDYLADRERNQMPIYVDASTWQVGEPFEDTIRRAVPFEMDTWRALARGQAVLFVDGISGLGEHSTACVAAMKTFFEWKGASTYVVVVLPLRSDGSLMDIGLPGYTLKAWNSDEIRAYLKAQMGPRSSTFLNLMAESDVGAQAMQSTPALLHGLLSLHVINPHSSLPSSVHGLIDRLLPAQWVFWSGTGALMPLTYSAHLKPALQDIALHMVDHELDSVSAVDLSLKLRDASLEAVQTARAMHIMRFENGRVSFTSSLIRDYFAAAGMSLMELRMRLRAPQFDGRGRRMFTHWDSVLQFAVALYSNPEEMLRNIAEIDPYLAAECIDEVRDISENALGTVLDPLLMDYDLPERHPALRTALRKMSADRIIPILLDRVTQDGAVATEAVAWAMKEFDVSLPLTILQQLEHWDWRPNPEVSALLRAFPDREHIVSWLADILDDSDPRRRSGAAWSLGELRDQYGLMHLRKAARQEGNASVREAIQEAINAIISSQETIAAPPTKDEYFVTASVKRASAEPARQQKQSAQPADPVAALFDALQSDEPDARERAMTALGKAPVSSYLMRAASLLERMAATKDSVRMALVRLLGQSGDAAVLEPLLKVVRHDPEVRIRHAALEELVKNEGQFSPGLVTLMQDASLSPGTLETVIRAVGQSQSDEVLNQLVRLLDDDRDLPTGEKVREVAFLALQHSARPVDIHARRQYQLAHQNTAPVDQIDDEDLVMAPDEAAAAGESTSEKMARLVADLQAAAGKTHAFAAAATALTRYARELSKDSDETVLPVLAAAMLDSQHLVRWAVIEATGFLRPDDALPQLNEALHDAHYTVRLAAINAMLEIGNQLSDVALLARMEDQHHEVRAKAAEALGELGTRETALRLVQYSRHPELLTRSAVIAALGKLGHPDTFPAIIQALHDSEVLVVATAIKALGMIRNPDAVPHLVELLEDERQTSSEHKSIGGLAIDALHSIGSQEALAQIHRFRARRSRR